jgi:hypothetical protein
MNSRTQTLTTTGKGPRQPDAPAGQPSPATAGTGGNPRTAAITAPGDRLADYGQKPARKRLLGTGRRRTAVALLAICLAASAVTWVIADTTPSR